jgi:low temperature requirement protein LtrA
MHFPMLYGVIAMAAATEAALAHPELPLATDLRIALGGGALLFICGTAAAIWRATGRAPLWRVVLALAAAIAVVAVGTIPRVAMGTLLATLVVIAAIEHRHTQARAVSAA